jgi:hypothetical protein
VSPFESAGAAALERAWARSLAALLDPSSALRRALPDLARETRLSSAGLEAGLACLAHGVRPAVLAALRERSTGATAHRRSDIGRPEIEHEVVILPGNLPALFLQPLARALAAGRSVTLKPASGDSRLTELFIEDLRRRAPELEAHLRVRRWHGGDRGVEDEVFRGASRVSVYGGADAIHAVGTQALAGGARVFAHGPKSSFAVAFGPPTTELASALARDVALFDQRGCLSVGVLLATALHADAWGEALAEALRVAGRRWPPGVPSAAEALSAQRARTEAVMAGSAARTVDPTAPAMGAVLKDPLGMPIDPAPSLRTVRIVSFSTVEEAAKLLDAAKTPTFGWQGMAVAAELPEPARERLVAASGASRVAPAGDLQDADATWDDGEEI